MIQPKGRKEPSNAPPHTMMYMKQELEKGQKHSRIITDNARLKNNETESKTSNEKPGLFTTSLEALARFAPRRSSVGPSSGG